MNNDSEVISFTNDNHVLHPGQKMEFVRIEYLDVRANYFQEGDTVEKLKALELIQKGLAKLKIIPEEKRRPKEIVRCKLLHRGLRNYYESDICHMEEQKAKKLEAEGVLRIVEGLKY